MLCCVVFLSCLGSVIYLMGFFLTRRSILHTSNCNSINISDLIKDNAIAQRGNEEGAKCWLGTEPKKIFLFIVDALRLDFMVSSNDSTGQGSYNKFSHMHHLLLNQSQNAHLFGFRADPPTVTAQRLKGITTGSFPTFMDISSNMQSPAVVEDNIIDQLVAKDKILVFTGDDTWHSLFPRQFHVDIPFDSLDTKDLFTVDDGIENYLNLCYFAKNTSLSETVDPTCLGNDWDLFVVHFLGADHIGHTHNAHHELMGQRLQRMDILLKRCISSLPDNSILFMFGDHGMTNEGNHGGSSTLETDSGLFVYSKEPIFSRSAATRDSKDERTLTTSLDADMKSLTWDPESRQFVWRKVADVVSRPRIVAQVDLVPSLALLMGIPIPYSNLGTVIPELFVSLDIISSEGAMKPKGSSCDTLLQALLSNALQVVTYLHEYTGTEIISNYAGALSSRRTRGGEGTSSAAAAGGSRVGKNSLTELDALLDAAIGLHAGLQNRDEDRPCNAELTTEGQQGRQDGDLDLHLCNSVAPDVGAPHVGAAAPSEQEQECIAAYLRVLEYAGEYGRRKWTVFDVPKMVFGITVLLLSIVLLARPLLNVASFSRVCKTCIRCIGSTRRMSISFRDLCRALPLLWGLFHCVSVFSNSFIIEELWVVYFGVQTCCIATLIRVALELHETQACGPSAAPVATAAAAAGLALHKMTRRRLRLAMALFWGAAALALTTAAMRAFLLNRIAEAAKVTVRHDCFYLAVLASVAGVCYSERSRCKPLVTNCIKVNTMTKVLHVGCCISFASSLVFWTIRSYQLESRGRMLGWLELNLPRVSLFCSVILIVVCASLPIWKPRLRWTASRAWLNSLLLGHGGSLLLLIHTPERSLLMMSTALHLYCAYRMYGDMLAVDSRSQGEAADSQRAGQADAKFSVDDRDHSVVTKMERALEWLSLMLVREVLAPGETGVSCTSESEDGSGATAATLATTVAARVTRKGVTETSEEVTRAMVPNRNGERVAWTRGDLCSREEKGPIDEKKKGPIDEKGQSLIDGKEKGPIDGVLILTIVLHSHAVGRLAYFLTGHAMSFSSLQLEVAFIGARKFHFFYAGFLLVLNTFGCDILAYFAMLAFFYSLEPTFDAATTTQTHDVDAAAAAASKGLAVQGGVVVESRTENETVYDRAAEQESPTLLQQQYSRTAECDGDPSCLSTTGMALPLPLPLPPPLPMCLGLSLGHRILLFTCSCLCCLLHRRHLMVWAIFAPKLAFEASFYLVTAVVIILAASQIN